MIEANRRILTPYYQALLEEGNRDGSLRTDYPGNWRNSSPSSPACGCCPRCSPPPRGRWKRKFKFLGEMLAAMGVPLFDESIQKVVDQFFDQIPEDLAPQTPK